MVGFLRAMPSANGSLKHGVRSLVTQLPPHPIARPVAVAGARNTAGAPGVRSQGNSGAGMPRMNAVPVWATQLPARCGSFAAGRLTPSSGPVPFR